MPCLLMANSACASLTVLLGIIVSINHRQEKLEMKETFEETIGKARKLLGENRENWEGRYASYASGILAREEEIKAAKRKFHKWKQLFVYTNVTDAKKKGDPLFQLRYRGQHIANLHVKGDSVKIKIEDEQRKSSEKNFRGCPKFFGEQDWRGKDAEALRAFFATYPGRNDNKKANEEHRIESLILSAIDGDGGNKELEGFRGIKPVKMFGIARFQFPTPLAASQPNDIKHSGPSGGGIDILARNKQRRICILELKAKPEKVSNVLKQGLAYAVFIRELLRSKSGEKWYRLMGFGGKVPSALRINVVAVMPDKPDADISFSGKELSLGDNDKAVLHYMYFTESNNEIIAIRTSL